MWIYVDDKHRVLGATRSDMSGNSEWEKFDGDTPDTFRDEYGVPLYAYENGVIRERTEEEREADRPVPLPQRPTLEEVYAALDMLLNGVTGDE